jgi:hypothetical protein
MAIVDLGKRKEYYREWLKKHGQPFGRCSYAPLEGNLGTNICGMYAHVNPEFQAFSCQCAKGNIFSGFEDNLQIEPCDCKRLKDKDEKKSS